MKLYLQLKKLTKKFHRNTAVQKLSLTVIKGELIAILGPSGCGKTTTLKMVGGFLKPDSGLIYLEGKDITDYPPNNRPTATVFQNYALFPHMNVIENIIYGLKYKDIHKKRAIQRGKEMLKMMGIEQYHSKNVNQLSGGERQRVALARAIIMDPAVLLLDEPLSNLDAKLKFKMRKEIQEIHSRIGVTTLYVTHDQEEALSIADRIVVMNEGRVEQVGKPEEVYYSPANHFVADFIGKINVIDKGEKKIFIRPEHIKILKKDGEYRGEILNRHFMGAYDIYYIDIGDNIIQVNVYNYEKKKWEKGEKVYVSFSKEKTRSFKTGKGG